MTYSVPFDKDKRCSTYHSYSGFIRKNGAEGSIFPVKFTTIHPILKVVQAIKTDGNTTINPHLMGIR